MNELIAIAVGLKLKIIGALAAAFGALLIAATDPPATKQALFLRAFVAIGCSILFGNLAVLWVDSTFHLSTMASPYGILDPTDLHAAVHGVVGAVAWFVVGAISTLLKSLKENPIDLFKRLKEAIKGS